MNNSTPFMVPLKYYPNHRGRYWVFTLSYSLITFNYFRIGLIQKYDWNTY
jgi:hypothetical protein